ncbi:SCO6745 family protein [Mycolicibacterium sp. HS_4_1]
MARTPNLARRFFERFEPVHAITYFAPESRAAAQDLGYRSFWSGYFVTRSAPLGPVPPRVVEAIFYNFASHRVAKSLAGVWDIATPEQALAARQAGAVAALNRYGLTADENLRMAADLLGRVARGAAVDGRPLFAALSAVPWPDEPVAALWHAATLLREQRGDAHVAALVAAGITGRESNVLHVAAGRTTKEKVVSTRDYDDTEWSAVTAQLAERGLLTADGSLTADGRALKDDIEFRTDAAALPTLDVLSDAEVETLFQALTPLARMVVAGGDLPAITPMALQHSDLDTAGANLG